MILMYDINGAIQKQMSQILSYSHPTDSDELRIFLNGKA